MIPSDLSLLSVCILFFFFFQAEDGIRDRNVTGVQTCALPIYCTGLQRDLEGSVQEGMLAVRYSPLDPKSYMYYQQSLLRSGRKTEAARVLRSEERRVGKEGRSGRGAAAEGRRMCEKSGARTRF